MKLNRTIGLTFITVILLTFVPLMNQHIDLASAVATAAATDTSGVDVTHLPLGDGHVGTAPKIGWIWACHTDPNGGGAFGETPWINKTDNTYDLTRKPTVSGTVSWTDQRLTISVAGNSRVISTNDLPDHPTGVFPIASSDAAYRYDRNPNRIAAQQMTIKIPLNPTLATQPGCAPGAVGVLLSGSVLFNALDAPGRDAVAHELQDGCSGHPQESGVYHYHSLSKCLPDDMTDDGHSVLVGYALDGFGIFGRRDVGGKILTSNDLDECHGHTHEIEWNGKKVVMYHYHATWDFRYTISCMRGVYAMANVMAISGGPIGGQQGNSQPGNGQFGPRQGGQPGSQPDLAVAAQKLGIDVQTLRDALGPPPPDLAAAAQKLGISEQTLRDALGIH